MNNCPNLEISTEEVKVCLKKEKKCNIEAILNEPNIEVDLRSGTRGPKGDNGKDATINGVNALNIIEGENIILSQEGDNLTISATGELSLDYNNIENKPSINNVIIQGSKTGKDYGLVEDDNYNHTDNNFTNIDKARTEGYIHEQGVPLDVWKITHNLQKYPSCTVVNSAGDEVYGDILYNDKNSLTITFNGAFSGKAYLN